MPALFFVIAARLFSFCDERVRVAAASAAPPPVYSTVADAFVAAEAAMAVWMKCYASLAKPANLYAAMAAVAAPLRIAELVAASAWKPRAEAALWARPRQ